VRDLTEIETVLRGDSPELREKIVRAVGSFTVALFAVFASRDGDRLELAGTGTLVAVAGSHYILTAMHVWDKVLKNAAKVGISLKEDIDHKSLMDVDAILSFGPPKPQTWGEWGPDLVFLRVPLEHVGAIKAHRVFYNLMIERKAKLSMECLEAKMLMGTPESSGKFSKVHASVQITGMFMQVDPPFQSRGGFDYLDLTVDISIPGVPKNFGGVSGGGLWKLLIYRATHGIDSVEILEGVAFHQSDICNSSRTIRCHGPQSIRSGMELTLKDMLTRQIGDCRSLEGPGFVLFFTGKPPVPLVAPKGCGCRDIFMGGTPPVSIWLCATCAKLLGYIW
jgi:hypothetical protein